MEMTIDNSIKGLKFLLKSVESKEDTAILKTAIDTMRKYQQIEKIVKEWSCGFGDGRYMYMVGKVVEDGNDD